MGQCFSSSDPPGAAYTAPPPPQQKVATECSVLNDAPPPASIVLSPPTGDAAKDEESVRCSPVAPPLPEVDQGGQPAQEQQTLLIGNTDLPPVEREAFQAFHARQQDGLYKVRPELQLLEDLQLSELLGSGGFAAVFKGLWRGSAEVAVKVFASSPRLGTSASGSTSASSQDNGQSLPAKALGEALLARGLSHPNIVRTFDVRCCRLTGEFMKALKQLSSTSQGFDSSPSRGGATLAEKSGRNLNIGPMLMAFTEYIGLTPLAPKRQASGEGNWLSDVSMDGFGKADQPSDNKALAWTQVLEHCGAKEGDFITVIIMQRANLGTLWHPIKSGVFTRIPNTCEDENRKRLRALLRSGREIAKGLEYLHACNVVHADMKPGNVLLNDNRQDSRGFTALLSDFGLARITASEPASPPSESEDMGGTITYMAPELFSGSSPTPESDVYAFGIMLWEMVHGTHAYADYKKERIIASTLKGQRPVWTAPAEAQLPRLGHIYMRCVLEDISRRPTAKELVIWLASLEDMARAESKSAQRAQRRRQQEQ